MQHDHPCQKFFKFLFSVNCKVLHQNRHQNLDYPLKNSKALDFLISCTFFHVCITFLLVVLAIQFVHKPYFNSSM